MKNPIRILIVEDEPDDAALAEYEICKTLSDCEFQVAETREGFLDALSTFQPDVILSDYTLPHFDGMKALELSLQHAPLTPLIIWTGSIGEDVAVDCMKAGANNYILKDNLKRLGPTVQRALAERELLIARRQAEEALQNNEKRFRALIENGPADISLLAADGTLLWESPSTTRNLGYAAGEFVGRNIFELMHPDDLAWTRDTYAKLLQRPGDRQHGIFRLHRADGTWRWVEAIATNLLSEPTVNAIVINYRDVTEQKQAELELQQRNADLALVNVLNEMINQGENLEKVVSLLKDELKRNFSSEYTNIYLLDQEKQSIKMQQYSLPPEVTRKIEKVIGRTIPTIEIPVQEDGIFQNVLRSGRGAVIADPESIRKWIGEFVETASLPPIAKVAIRKLLPQIYKILNIKSTILVPLISDGQIVGVLNVSSANILTDQDLKRIEHICGQLTTALRRKQVEDALRESQARYQNLVETSHDLIWTVDAEGRITFMNRAAKEIYGYEPEELIGRSFFEIMDPEHLQHNLKFYQETIANADELREIETYVRHRDGRQIILSANSIVLRDSHGNVTGAVGSSHDITARKQVEEALKEERNLLRTLIDNIPDRIYAMDLQGRKTLSNIADWKASGGKTMEDVIGKTDFDTYPPALAEDFWKVDQAVLQSGQPIINYEEPGLDADGNFVSILTSKIPLRDDNGNVIGLVGIGHDITERKQAEARINDLLEFNEKILNHSSIGILTYKVTGECVYANEIAASMVGAQVEQLKAKNFHTLESWKTSGLYELVQTASRTQAPVAADIHINTSYGKEVWMTVHCVSFKLKEQDHLLISAIDITERKRTEERLRRSENQYRLATKATNDVIWEWDPKTHQLLWSENARHVFGYPEAEIGLDEKWWDHRLHPNDRARVLTKLDALISGNDSIWLEEYRFLLKDGSYAHIIDRGYVERDEHGTPLRMIGAMSDITSRKEVEIERQALLEIMQGFANTKELQELLKLIHDSIAKVIYAENFFVVLYQEKSGFFEEIYSVDQYDLPEPPSKLENSITSYVFRSGEPLLLTQASFEELAAQGEVQLVGTDSASWLGVPLKTSSRTIGVMAVQDYENDNRYSDHDKDFLSSIATQVALVIEHRRAGEALRESEEHYRTIFEGVQDAIFVESLDGKILMVNERACEMFGYSQAEFLTKTVADLVPPSHPILMTDGEEGSISAEPRETINQRANGEVFPIEISGRVQVINGEKVLLVVVRDITERKQSEDLLRESEERFSGAFEYASIGMALVAPNGALVRVNWALCWLLGYSETELLGKTFVDLTHPEDIQDGLNRVEKLLAGEIDSFEVEKRYFHKQGHVVWGLLSVSLVKDHQGKPQHFIAQIQDITERRRVEESLQAERKKAEKYLETAGVMMLALDRQGAVTLINQKGCEILGYSANEIIGKNWIDTFLPQATKEEMHNVFQRIISDDIQSLEYYENSILTKSGEERLIAWHNTLLRDEQGEIISSLSSGEDITQRKQVETALRESVTQFRTLFEASPDAIVLIDPNQDWTIIDCNAVACQMNGYTREELLGQSVNILNLTPGHPNERKEYMESVRQHGVLHYETSHRRKDGTVFTVDVSTSLIKFGTRDLVLGIDRDVTERKRAEKEIGRRAEETSALLQTSLALTSLDLESTLQTVGNSANRLFLADGCRIFLLEPDGETLRCVLALGENTNAFLNLRIKIGQGVTGAVAASGRAEIINDMQNDPRALQVAGTEEEPEAIMFAPLKERDRVIGILSIRRVGREHPFQDTDLELLEAFASMTASAVSNARLFEETQQRLAELNASEERFRQLADNIQEVFWMTDAETGRELYLSPAVETIWGRSIQNLMYEPNAWVNSVFSEDRSVLLDAIKKEKEGKKTQFEYRIVRPDGSLRWIWDRAFPIYDDAGRVKIIAGISADITDRKQIEIETRRHIAELEAVYENGLSVGRLLEPREIGNRVIETFSLYLSWHHVTIRLRKEDSDELELVAFSLPELKEEEKAEVEQHYVAFINKVGRGLSGWVIETGVPLRTGNVHAHPQYVDTHAGIHSGLYMPLKVGDRIIGVISVESEAPNAFTEQDQRLLATLANQTAIAFENARLYEAMQNELSERKRVEDALRVSETHYRALADSITDILFELDQDLHYTHWNKASETLIGVSAQDVIGKSMGDILGATEEQARIKALYEQVLQTHQRRTFETNLVISGETRSFEVNAYPSMRGVSVVAKDVTDRKRTEAIMQKRFELMEYSARHSLKDLMQRTVDEVSQLTESTIGFFHFMEDDQLHLGMQTWSTNALQLFHVSAEDGAHLPLDQAGVWAEAVRQRRPLIQNDYESLAKKKGLPQGHVPIQREMIIPIIRNERIMAVMGIANKPQEYTLHDLDVAARLADYAWDVTERKLMEIALEVERNQLVQRVEERTADLSRANSNLARALRVKDEFLANMSHELRTPLNAILGLSESLGEQIAGPLNEKQQKYISTISESGHHLLSLINDILDLAKIDAGQITLDINKVDIHSVCQASLRMVKQLAQKKNQEVSLEIDNGLGLMWADERRLKQMIVNLLGNAVKFTPENGKLGLEVHGDEEANQIAITVWDNGIGIKKDDLARLFQPFVQLDSGLAREATGTGLGLALVAQMARLHGGSVNAISEAGKGSRFTIILPWEPALAIDTASRMKITGKFRTIKLDEKNKPTILLVEDTKEVVMMLKDYLELAGYRVFTAQDGIDGMVQARHVKPDLILMDVQMPRMDGFETTRKLRSDPNFRYTPIIALTALAMPHDRERCLEAGMDEYISKPVNLKALVKIIQGCLFEQESRTR